MILPINIENISSFLEPPAGYRFDKSVITTYSLHLDILLTIPLFLDGALKEEHAVIENYQAVVMMINRFKDSIQVYVQEGEIKSSAISSKKYSKLYELLRDMITEIPTQKYRSFHPKFWLISYKNEDNTDKKYKLIVLSKNLTNSKDLDIAIVFDGTIADDSIHKNINNKIFNFLDETIQDTNFSMNELSKIEWMDINGYQLTDIFFIPKDKNNIPFLEDKKFRDECIVFSPFVDKRTGDKNLFSSNNILVTREDEVNTEICQNIYKLNDSIVDNEIDNMDLKLFEKSESEDIPIPTNQLHAKIYVYKKDNQNWLTFGSANATERGFNRNDEILIHLKAPSGFYKHTKEYILDDKKRTFIQFIPKEKSLEEKEKVEILDILDDVKSNILADGINEVKYKSKTKNLTMKLKDIDLRSDVNLLISPISLNQLKQFEEDLKWEIKEESQITGWFRFILLKDGFSREFLIKSELDISETNYIKEIMQEAADNSQKFLDANIYALLSNGKVLAGQKQFNSTDTSNSEEHCYSHEITEDIVDMLLDRYAADEALYQSVLCLISKSDKYKKLIDILPRAKKCH